MASDLPAVGVLTYNGFTFPPHTNVKVINRPVKDEASRKVKYNELTIEASFVLTSDIAPTSSAGQSTDTNMENIRTKLLNPGQALRFTSKGFGTDVQVNTGGYYTDVMYGPDVDLSWEPLGGNLASTVVWRCVAHIPPCFNISRILGYTFDTSFRIDRTGRTQRVISGTMEINVNVQGTSIDAVADEFRHLVQANQIPGFTREQVWTTDRTQRLLQFSITDTEEPSDNAYYPYMLKPSIHQTVSSRLQGSGFGMWEIMFSGSITVRPGVNKVLAWNGVQALINERLTYQNQGQAPGGSGSSGFKFLTSVSINDEVFGDSFFFNISYMFACSLSTIIAASGLWRPINGTNWAVWQASVAEAFGERGFAKLGLKNTDVAIVEVCGGGPGIISGQRNFPSGEGGSASSNSNAPPEDKSWVTFDNRFYFKNKQDVAKHTVLKLDMAPSPGSGQPTPSGQQATSMYAGDSSNVVQRRSPGVVVVVMEGTATRIHYPVKVPQLTSLGNNPVFEVDRVVKVQQASTVDQVMHKATWRIEYAINVVASSDLNLDSLQSSVNPNLFQ